jgi:hypothetical protein
MSLFQALTGILQTNPLSAAWRVGGLGFKPLQVFFKPLSSLSSTFSLLRFQALIGILQTPVGDLQIPQIIEFQALIGILQTTKGTLHNLSRRRFQALIGILQTAPTAQQLPHSSPVSSPYRYSSNEDREVIRQTEKRQFQALIGILQTLTKSVISRSFVKNMRITSVHH